MGKILTRFSEDLTICENISFSIGPLFLIGYLGLGIIFIALFVSRGLAFPIVIFYFIYLIKLQVKFQKPNDFFKRNRMSSEAPIPSYFSETLQGLPIIRAYGYQQQFIDNNFKNLNKSSKAMFYSLGVISWFIVRLVLISCGITIPILAICLFFKNWQTGGDAGLFLTYAL